MKPDPLYEADRWFRQAEDDLSFARLAHANGYSAQCCFICQQVCEKALKAIFYAKGERLVLGHSVLRLLTDLGRDELHELVDGAKMLDQFYVPTRYPNGLPDGVPSEVYTEAQAHQAIVYSEQLMSAVEAILDEYRDPDRPAEESCDA